VLEMETWLMSCRVLGRGVEEATLNILIEEAKRLGCDSVVGIYRPSAKNDMVREHYQRLGFTLTENFSDGSTRWTLSTMSYNSVPTSIEIKEGNTWKTLTSTAH
jgi:predicted enzyme involved in methoxymalonyl-ACP biosynthesis